MLKPEVTRKLGEIVGAENVVTEGGALARYSRDAGLGASPPDALRLEPHALRAFRLARPPLGREAEEGVAGRGILVPGPEAIPRGRLSAGAEAVVRPRRAEEVRQAVALARDEGIPLTVRGGGTGLWGGAVPLKGGIVVSCENLAGEPEVHREDLYVVVGPGMITGRLRAELAAGGLFYPVDPASEAACTIGGNVGEGADGLRSLKYGTTRNYVLGLELVTPQAELMRVGARTVKNVAGYDLTRLMVGSEGTLAIAISVTLRVLPLPPDEVILAFPLADGARAAEAASDLLARGANPSLVEFMDGESLKVSGESAWEGVGGLLLVGFDGTPARCADEASLVKESLQSKYGVAAAMEARRPEGERILRARRRVLAGLIEAAEVVLLEDLTVPPARLARMVAKISEVSRKRGTRVAVWGHAGRGAVHVALPVGPGQKDGAAALATAAGTISELVCACEELGGTAYGGAGPGSGKLPPPRIATSGAGLDVLAELKRVIDPKGIMNPGKMTYEA